MTESEVVNLRTGTGTMTKSMRARMSQTEKHRRDGPGNRVEKTKRRGDGGQTSHRALQRIGTVREHCPQSFVS